VDNKSRSGPALSRAFEVRIYTFMQAFKRNQVDAGIVRTLGTREQRVADLKVKLKRLLVVDRHLESGKRSAGRADPHYAFYSHKPLGSGVEVMFSGYEAFALMIALIHAGTWNTAGQGRAHTPANPLGSGSRPSGNPAERSKGSFRSRGSSRGGSTRPDRSRQYCTCVFDSCKNRYGRLQATISVCRGLQELAKFIKKHSLPGSGATHFELVRLMHTLADNLSKTRPVKRGRSTN
jgi:hypothetical protein